MASQSWIRVEQEIAEGAAALGPAEAALSQGVAIFGAGYHGRLALEVLRGYGAEIRCFVDNDSAKHGTQIQGIEVVSPAELADRHVAMTLIAARHAVIPVLTQLSALGLPAVSFDALFVSKNLPRFRSLRDGLLSDDRSRTILDGLLMAMITGRRRYCAEVMEPDQYFALPQFLATGTEHFIDAGAYVGDTLERFLWANNGAFASIHAFEPGPVQYNAMKQRVNRLNREWALPEGKICCMASGLGAQTGQAMFSSSPDMLQNANLVSGAGEQTVTIYALDDYLSGRPATFIKADVEGMEMDVLTGAARTITTFRPKLALSVYHEPAHLFSIAEKIKALVPEYRMALRHHAAVLMETVLYCWIDE